MNFTEAHKLLDAIVAKDLANEPVDGLRAQRAFDSTKALVRIVHAKAAVFKLTGATPDFPEMQ